MVTLTSAGGPSIQVDKIEAPITQSSVVATLEPQPTMENVAPEDFTSKGFLDGFTLS